MTWGDQDRDSFFPSCYILYACHSDGSDVTADRECGAIPCCVSLVNKVCRATPLAQAGPRLELVSELNLKLPSPAR